MGGLQSVDNIESNESVDFIETGGSRLEAGGLVETSGLWPLKSPDSTGGNGLNAASGAALSKSTEPTGSCREWIGLSDGGGALRSKSTDPAGS